MTDSIDEYAAKLESGKEPLPHPEPHELVREALAKAPHAQRKNEIQRTWDGLVAGVDHLASLGVKLVLRPFEHSDAPAPIEYPKMIKLNDSGSKHIIVYSREEEEAELEKIVGDHSVAERVEEAEVAPVADSVPSTKPTSSPKGSVK